ncbi:MAG: hypothetical protein KDB79_07830 [Acidobacteria bacterium]|nr:hypothetical protein [Acidobacteriota bacterium]
MTLSRYLNFNTIVLSLVGLLMIAKGLFNLILFRDYIFAGGISMLGAGFIIFGITNGFADPTPRGRLLFRIAIPALLIGGVLTLYSMRYYFMF